MSSALETLLEAARFIELQEQREQRLTSTSSSSSLSTSPFSSSRYPSNNNIQCGQQLVSTPPASPVTSTDGLHHRHHLIQGTDFGGSTIIRAGECSAFLFFFFQILFEFFFILPILILVAIKNQYYMDSLTIF